MNNPDSPISYKHFFHKLVEAMPWPMLIIDADTQIVHCNGQVAALFGLRAPVTGRLDQLLDDAAILLLIQTVIQTGSAQCGEFDRVSSGGAWKVSVTPVEHRKMNAGSRRKDAEGAEQVELVYQYFSVVIEDLSELHRLGRVPPSFL